MANPIIYLDMDGVVSDFVGWSLSIHDRKDAEVTSWDIESALGMTQKEFHAPMVALGSNWWRLMPPFEWRNNLYLFCLSLSRDTFFLTSPSEFKDAPLGKWLWLEDWLGRGFDKFIFTNHKRLLAGPNAILVDDSERNVDQFNEAGGTGILFPTKYNRGGERNDTVDYICGEIFEAVTRIVGDKEGLESERCDRLEESAALNSFDASPC